MAKTDFQIAVEQRLTVRGYTQGTTKGIFPLYREQAWEWLCERKDETLACGRLFGLFRFTVKGKDLFPFWEMFWGTMPSYLVSECTPRR